MRILVMGASGFVGRTLACFLAENHDVTGTCFRNPLSRASFRQVGCDLADASQVREILRSQRPELVFHLAYSLQDCQGSIVRGMKNLVPAMDPGVRLVYVSTDMVFDGQSPPYSEDTPPSPVNEYGRAKARAEALTLTSGGFVVRTSLVYGFSPPDKTTAALFSALESGVFPYPYFSDEVRCPVLVDDLARGLMETGLAYRGPRRIFHVAGPEALSRLELAGALARAMGAEDRVIPSALAAEVCPERPRDLTLKTAETQKALSIRPRDVGRAVEEFLAGSKEAGRP